MALPAAARADGNAPNPEPSPSPSIALLWQAPPSCPDDTLVQSRLAKPTDVQTTGGVQDPMRVQAVVTRDPDGVFRLTLDVGNARGSTRREVTAPNCETLAETAILVAGAFVVDEVSASPPPSEVARDVAPAVPSSSVPSSSVPSSSVPSSSVPQPRVAGPTRPPAPRRVAIPKTAAAGPGQFSVHAGAVLGRAAQPDIDAGPILGMAWARGLPRIEVELTAVTARSRAHPTHRGVTLRQSFWLGAVHGCVQPGRGRIRVPLCVGTEAGAAVGRGRGVSSPRTAVTPWGAVSLKAGAEIWLSPAWAIWGGVQGVVGYAVSAFTVGDATVLQARRGGLRGRVGVRWRFSPRPITKTVTAGH